MIRGDLATIEIGVNCLIGANAIIRPAEQKIKGGAAFIPVTIGDYVLIQDNSIIQAASIGSHVLIGANSVIGKRCIVSNCCDIAPNAVLAPGTVTPPFSRWEGNPAKLVSKLPEVWPQLMNDYMKGFFSAFQPTETSATAAATNK
jgi:dynactin-5